MTAGAGGGGRVSDICRKIYRKTIKVFRLNWTTFLRVDLKASFNLFRAHLIRSR